ncbi:MAG: hypothetical protein NC218_02335 [Acetobacter sp.]|nr:hypothetical protein [Acetobacter sp.]
MANQFMEKVLGFLKPEDKRALDRLVQAIGRAIKQEIAENKKTGKRSFHLLEGTVFQHNNGKYEFIPSKSLYAMLQGDPTAVILKTEESRFLELLRLALAELAEPEVEAAKRKKEEEQMKKDQEQARKEALERQIMEEEMKKRDKEGW